MKSFDAIVIGGGHNGLVAAAILGKSGRKVLVLEAGNEAGGAARTEEFAPGFRVSSVAHVLNRLHPQVADALDLRRHGLSFAPDELAPSVALSQGGEPLTMLGAYGQTIAGATASQAIVWQALRSPACAVFGHPEAFPHPPGAGTFRNVVCRRRCTCADRTGTALSRQGRHAGFPPHAPDEHRRRAGRTSEG